MPTTEKPQQRPYQQRVISNCVQHFQQGIQSILMESAVGSGKTFMALSVAKPFAEQGLTVGWCAMRRNLLTQAEAEAQRFGFRFPVQYISMFDRQPPKVDFLVVDESHHDATSSMAHIHATSRPKFILGPTATGFRRDRATLCFQRTVRGAGIGELIEAGYLSQYEHYTIRDWTPYNVASTYLRDPGRWGQSMMFFLTAAECCEAQQILEAGGIRAAVVLGSDLERREQQLQAFRCGDIDVLLNIIILTEGFNMPQLQTVFIRPVTAGGKGLTVQMGGRVLRPCDGIPVKRIVQSEDTRWPFQRIGRACRSFKWDGRAWILTSVVPELEALIDSWRDEMQRLLVAQVQRLQRLQQAAVERKGGDLNPDELRDLQLQVGLRERNSRSKIFNADPDSKAKTLLTTAKGGPGRRRGIKGLTSLNVR